MLARIRRSSKPDFSVRSTANRSAPLRGVRIEAARIQGDVPESQIPADRLNARASTLKEYQYYLALLPRSPPICIIPWACCWYVKSIHLPP